MSDLHHHSGSGPNHERQEAPHPHCIMQDANNRFVFVPDLGIDRVVVYQLDTEQQKLIPHDSVPSPAGSGPRHIAFHPNGQFAYVVNELDATVSAFRYDAEAGKLTALQHAPSLPADFKGENTAAEVRISPDGRFLYMSNRGADNITVFSIIRRKGRSNFAEVSIAAVAHRATSTCLPTGASCSAAIKIPTTSRCSASTQIAGFLADRARIRHPGGRMLPFRSYYFAAKRLKTCC